jgi:hypothetical protein
MDKDKLRAFIHNTQAEVFGEKMIYSATLIDAMNRGCLNKEVSIGEITVDINANFETFSKMLDILKSMIDDERLNHYVRLEYLEELKHIID